MASRGRMASPLRARRKSRVSPAVTSVAPRSPVRSAKNTATKKKAARKAPAKKATRKAATKKTAVTRRSPAKKCSPSKRKAATKKKAARKAPAKKTTKKKATRKAARKSSAGKGLVVPADATWMDVVKMSKNKINPETGKAYTFKDLSKIYKSK